MKKTICKKLAAIVMTGVMALSCLIPHMQVMAAQQTPAEGRMPLKGISYGYHSETYYLPADAQFYYEPQVDINPISGNIIIFTAKNAQNKVIAELDFGFEYVDIAVCTNYDEASDVGVIRTSLLYDIENGDSSTYMYGPDGRLILDRELGSYLFQYDATGRPVSCTCFGEQYLYEYNEIGKISTTYVKYSDASDFTPEKLLTYDEKGNLLKYEFCYSNLDGVEMEPMVDISYDDYGNPLSMRFYDCGYMYQEITMIY